MDEKPGTTSTHFLYLALVILPALALLSAIAIGYSEESYTPIISVLINSTKISPAIIAEPLTPLTKVDCGKAVAIVYGYESGKPLLVVIYGEEGIYHKRVLADALSCPKRLLPCLSAAGLSYVAKELEQKVLSLNKTSLHTNATGEAAMPTRHNSYDELLLIGLGLVTGLLVARLKAPRYRGPSSP